MTGYVRADTGNNIANGNFIDATYLDAEFDAIVAAFNASTGHVHDGSSANGGPITVLGPAQDFITSSTELRPKTTNVYDLGTTTHRFKTAYFSGSVNADGNLTVDGNTVLGGTLSVTGAITGNASTATKWATARNITFSGGVIGSTSSFDGSANGTASVTLDANYITQGTIASARLPTSSDSGTTTWLRTLLGNSAASGVVGYPTFLRNGTLGTLSPGDTVDASLGFLKYADSDNNVGATLTTGVYMCLGRAVSNASTLFIRVS